MCDIVQYINWCVIHVLLSLSRQSGLSCYNLDIFISLTPCSVSCIESCVFLLLKVSVLI